MSICACLSACVLARRRVCLSVCLFAYSCASACKTEMVSQGGVCRIAYALILFAKVSDVNLQAPSPATQTQVQLQQQQLRHWPPYRLQQMELQTPQQAQQAQQPQQAQQQH